MPKSLAADTHSFLSPSGAHRWAYCTASPNYIKKLKDDNLIPKESSSTFADLGTAAHTSAAKVLLSRDWFDHDFYESPDQEEFVPVYINYIHNLSLANPNIKWHIEQKVNPAKYIKTNHCKGTADAIGIVPEESVYIVDYKHGEYIVVDVEDNLQVILYALGALAKLAKQGYDVSKLRIILVIVQPRAYHPDGDIREWETTYKELMRWARWLRKCAAEALGPNPIFKPDPDHQCRFCEAQGNCRALAEYELTIAREVFRTIIDDEAKLKDPNRISHKELSYLLDQLPHFKRWQKNISAYAVSALESGAKVPYWGLRESLSDRMWENKDELELYFDEEVLYERKLRSPAQVEKLEGKGSVDNFTTRVPTGHTIKKTDDPEESDESIPFEALD